MEKEKITAIVLAGGSGKRMGGGLKKQYLSLGGQPLLSHSLRVFQESRVDEIVLVSNEEAYCQEEIVEKYGFDKVKRIVPGGAERYDSVWQGLKAVRNAKAQDMDGYIFIHDGARMFVDESILKRGYETVLEYRACVAGMPSKDTVKLVDDEGFAVQTPKRKYVWTVQTPQIFETSLIMEAYSRLMREQYI